MRILFVIPGDINLPTGGYRYDRKVVEEWRKEGNEVTVLSLPGNYPFPTAGDKQAALALADELGSHEVGVIDGLAGGAHPDVLEKLAQALPLVALIHHPLCLESGLDEEQSSRLKQSEADGLEYVNSVVTTSPETARMVASLFDIERLKIDCVLPGVERARLSTPPAQETINLLCVGSMIERKGHIFLVKALAQLKAHKWKLDCIGKTDFQQWLFEDVQTLIRKEGLHERIEFHGSVEEDELEKAYGNAHVFVLPSLYEGYGMVYAEAITRGLPVIGTTAGAIPDTVPKECGILVEPENVDQLKNVLETMILNDKVRGNYRKAAIKAAGTFPTWQNSAAKFASILRDII